MKDLPNLSEEELNQIEECMRWKTRIPLIIEGKDGKKIHTTYVGAFEKERRKYLKKQRRNKK